MSLAIGVTIRERYPCPHCGKPVLGEIIEDRIRSGGDSLYHTLEKIGYGDEQYGKYIELTDEQATILARDCLANEVCDYKEIVTAIGAAVLSGNAVILEADW